mmetsp:Transcript_356/g.419  ORF Transcript_356/g.419 Transcript_356/m.419 type:complete len:255 (-) Transcript_356:220-984(-)
MSRQDSAYSTADSKERLKEEDPLKEAEDYTSQVRQLLEKLNKPLEDLDKLQKNLKFGSDEVDKETPGTTKSPLLNEDVKQPGGVSRTSAAVTENKEEELCIELPFEFTENGLVFTSSNEASIDQNPLKKRKKKASKKGKAGILSGFFGLSKKSSSHKNKKIQVAANQNEPELRSSFVEFFQRTVSYIFPKRYFFGQDKEKQSPNEPEAKLNDVQPTTYTHSYEHEFHSTKKRGGSFSRSSLNGYYIVEEQVIQT